MMVVETLDLVESYAALFIAIRYRLENADIAFKMLDNAIENPFMNPKNGTKEDVENMIRLRKENMTLKDIGLMYGITDQAVYDRIRYYKKKVRKGAMQ